jgi:uncharacterized protein YdaU (DUF1376 family)
LNYYERHIGDYLKDTAHLSLLQHGIYARLLDVYYTKEAALPEADALRLIGARSKEERAAAIDVLAEFFTLVDGAWSQSRCDAEIARYRDKQEKAKRSAEARWSESGRNANAKQSADAKSMRTHSDGSALQTPDTNVSEAKASAGAAGKVKVKDPETIIFAYGVPMLTAAGSEEKHARSFLGGLRKHHGDEALVNALRECIKAKPLQPLEWLAAALPPEKALDYKQPEQPWHQTRAGIQAKGIEYGIEAWDQAAWERGEREAWPQYEARVFAAAGHSPRAAA